MAELLMLFSLVAVPAALFYWAGQVGARTYGKERERKRRGL